MARYRFYGTPGPRVICVSSYAGQKVRGVAICDENDEYDFEKGKALAQARVDVEIASRRVNRARAKLDQAWEDLVAAEVVKDKMENYLDDATNELAEAQEHLAEILGSM